MKIVYFTHSLLSCWNHGNAHFVRGVLREMVRRGHEVVACEPHNAWSLANLRADHGEAGLESFTSVYPELHSRPIAEASEAAEACEQADLVIVHEWNEPALVAAIGRVRRHSRFTLLFHDTHHRAVSNPGAMARLDLTDYDGILAFGESLADLYRRDGWGRRVFVWHEAADVTVFHPPSYETLRHGLVWIGNWGEGERAAELEHFLLEPAQIAGTALDVFGVRYPPEALAMLDRYGARYCGWLANAAAPGVFARHVATVHVPRRAYTAQLAGIPTIRVFEALSCGIPLVSAPWEDREGLFRPGQDFLVAQTGEAMRRSLTALQNDPALRASVVAHGLETILGRHTCGHRVDELLAILADLRRDRPVCVAENA